MTRTRSAAIVTAVVVGVCMAAATEMRAEACMAAPSGLVSWFPGDGNAVDVAGGHDGVLVGGAGYGPGKVLQAFALDGIDGAVSTPDNDAWTLGGDFTVMAWVSLASVGASNPIVTHMEASAPKHGWAFGLSSGVLELHYESPGSGVVQPVSAAWTPAAATWHHVAVSRAGSAWSLYIDGAPVGSGSDGSAMPDAVAPLAIGAGEGAYSSGRIDEVQIYSRALSASEIAAIHAAGSAGVCKGGLDTMTVGSGQACPGGSVDVPLYIRDLSGTPLGVDKPAGERIQGFGVKVSYTPAEAVSAVSFSRAGITAGLEPSFERTTRVDNTISYVLSFDEGSDPIPFTLDAPLPGDQVAALHLTTSAAAEGTIELSVDVTVSELSNQGGTITERPADGTLRVVDGVVSVGAAPAAPAGLAVALASGPDVDLSWIDQASDETGYEVERRQAGDAEFSSLATLAADSQTYHDGSGLVAGTAYFYRVRALDDCPSSWSNVASIIVPGESSAFCDTRVTTHRSAETPYLAHGNGFFGAVWREVVGDSCAIAYAKLDASGQITKGPVAVTPWADQSAGAQLVWNGSEWGLLWYERLGDVWGLFFERLDGDGNRRGGAVRLNVTTALLLANNYRNRGLAWDGAGWGVVWRGRVGSSARNAYFAHLTAAGVVDVPEVAVGDSPADLYAPEVVFNGFDFGVVWFDYRIGPGQYFYRRIGLDGVPGGPSVQVTEMATDSAIGHPDLAWSGSAYGLTWVDTRDGDEAAYLRTFDLAGAPLSAETRITDPVSEEIHAYDLVLRFLGDRWAVASEDYRGWVCRGIQLSFASLAGAKLGADVRIAAPSEEGLWFDFPALAWDGSTLLATWFGPVDPEALEIFAQATDHTGDRGTNPLRVITAGHTPGGGIGNLTRPALTFLGNGHAVAWVDTRNGKWNDVFLQLTDSDGVPATPEIRVNEVAGTTSTFAFGPAIAFSGEVIGVLWQDASGRALLTRFDTAGARLGADLVLGSLTSFSGSLLWTGEVFLAAWSDSRDGNQEIYTAAVAADGSVLAAANRISEASGQSNFPSLAGDGRVRVVAWRDGRNGKLEIYAAALDPMGARVGPEVPITDQPGSQNLPSLAWNGSEFALAWQDARDPSETRVWGLLLDDNAQPISPEGRWSDALGTWPYAVWAQDRWVVAYNGPSGVTLLEVDPAGGKLGPDRVVAAKGVGPGIDFNGQQVVLGTIFKIYMDSEVHLTSAACALDSTLPSCPTGLTAVAHLGSVDLAWTGGSDSDFALAWQYVYRDGVRVAVVEPGVTAFTDFQPAVGDHTYSITSLNQGNLESEGCATAVAHAPTTGDANGDSTTNVLDVFYLINYLFAGGPPPR